MVVYLLCSSISVSQGFVFDIQQRALTANWTQLSFSPLSASVASGFVRSVTGDDGRGGALVQSSSTLMSVTVQPTRLGTTLWTRDVTDGCNLVTTTVLLSAECKPPPSFSMLSLPTSRFNTSGGGLGSFAPIVLTASVSGASFTDSLSMRWIYARVSPRFCCAHYLIIRTQC